MATPRYDGHYFYMGPHQILAKDIDYYILDTSLDLIVHTEGGMKFRVGEEFREEAIPILNDILRIPLTEEDYKIKDPISTPRRRGRARI